MKSCLITGSNEETVENMLVTEGPEKETKKDEMQASESKGGQPRLPRVVRSDRNKAKPLPPKRKSDFILSKISQALTPHPKIYEVSITGTSQDPPTYTQKIKQRKDKFKKMEKARKGRARKQKEKEKYLITNRSNHLLPAAKKPSCPSASTPQTPSPAPPSCPTPCLTAETLWLIQEKIKELEMKKEMTVEEEYKVGFQLGSLNRRLWRRTSGRRGGAIGSGSRRSKASSILKVLHHYHHFHHYHHQVHHCHQVESITENCDNFVEKEKKAALNENEINGKFKMVSERG